MSVRASLFGTGAHPLLARAAGLGNAALDLLFPPHCAGCARFGAWLCSECIEAIDVIQPPICVACGWSLNMPHSARSLPGEGAGIRCSRCVQASSQLDGKRAYARHAVPLRRAIHQLKYDSLRALADPLGGLMADGWAYLAPRDVEIDAIVPIPLHQRRQRERGYNQAVLLARVLGRKLGIAVDETVLVRIRHTRPQVGLNVAQRQANLLGAFQQVGEGARQKRLLLVDDVCTSGSTLQEAAAALRQGGASQVWAYTLAQA